MWAELVELIKALFTFDSYTISSALKSPAAWILGFFATIGLGYLLAKIYDKSPKFSENFEKTVMVTSYLVIALIIFVEVIRRFVFSVQAPWSTTLPPVLFMIMAWAGCAYNVHTRTHLSFSETRSKLGPSMQMACLTLDALLWIGFSWVVIVTSTRVVANSAANFQILLGTDGVMQWWFLLALPISFICVTARAMQNWKIDFDNYRAGEVLIKPSALVGD